MISPISAGGVNPLYAGMVRGGGPVDAPVAVQRRAAEESDTPTETPRAATEASLPSGREPGKGRVVDLYA